MYQEQKHPILGAAPFVCFVPDYTSEQELYRIDDCPVNIVDNSNINPIIQNIAQQQLIDVSDDSLPTVNLSDRQLADSCIPRFAEVSDIEDIANNNLRNMSKIFNESQVKD